MKVTWLDDDLTEAQVITGRLWWKRCAMVHRRTPEEWKDQPGSHWWSFASGRAFPLALDGKLEALRSAERTRREQAEDWTPWPPARRKSLPWAKITAEQRKGTLTLVRDADR